VFRRDHDVWTLSFAGATITLPDAKGLRDIATLIAAPGVEISAAELAGLPAAGADPVLDDAARAAYKARLAELDDKLDRGRRQRRGTAGARAGGVGRRTGPRGRSGRPGPPAR
jgi:hypothetical protein